MRIIILEDNADRRACMSSVLADMLPEFVVEYFVTSREMIDYLSRTGLYDVALISLDNDLDMIESEDGQLIDSGDGVEVAKWLTTQPAVAPVVIHTTNIEAGRQMEIYFDLYGWVSSRVVPYEGETWIGETWRSTVRNLVVRLSPERTVSSLGVPLLKLGMQSDWPIEHIAHEILRMTVVHTTGLAQENLLCFELTSLNEDNSLSNVVRSGFSLFSELHGGTARHIWEESRNIFGVGPLAASNEKIESSFRQFLIQKDVLQIQLDAVQLDSENQTMLMTATKSSQFDLHSPSIQTNIREVRGLLELSLILALRNSFEQQESDLDASRPTDIDFI